MNFKIKTFILILILLIGVGCVAASEIDDNATLSQDTTIIYDNFTQDELKCADFSNENESLESSEIQEVLEVDESDDVIVVENWDELQYYCSLKDDDYTLKLKENTSFYPTDPSDSNYQIKVYNNVKIIGGEGSYIGYESSNAPLIKYAAIIVPDNYKSSINMENVNFKWISVGYSSDGVFIQMGGRRANVFKNCNFNNIVTWFGHSCVVHLKRGTATLDNCSFIGCTNAYGVVSVYDPNSIKTTDMIIRNCYFEGNYARTEPGCINNCGKLTVYNTTFYKNRASAWAGAIHTHSGGSTTIYDSNFTDNVAGWNGGALYTYSYLNIYNTVFSGNNCTTNSGGGAIGACSYGSNPHIYIENCLFEKNTNTCWSVDQLSNDKGAGGAIAIMDDGSIVVLNTTFIANSAAYGCAISASAAAEYGSPSIIIANNTFVNHTNSETLRIYVEGSTAILEGNYFEGNYVIFKDLTLNSLSSGKDYATLQVNIGLANPNCYDSDILNRIGFRVYVNGEYVKTVYENVFTVDFDDFDICDVYVVPTMSNIKSNEVHVVCLRDYIYVSKSLGNDSFDGLSRDTPVSTIKHALDLAGSFGNILILDGFYDEGNLEINYDLTIKGEGNATLTKNTRFTVNSNNFTLKNIKLSNLSGDTFIKQNNGDLSINNCIFNDNQITYLFDANYVNISKSIFTNNNIISSNNVFTNIKNSILLNNTKIVDKNMDNIILDYNWWGNTLNNFSKPTSLNINNWLFLNVTCSKTSLELGKSSIVQFNCYLVNDTQLTKYDELTNFNFEIYSINGTVNKNKVKYNSNVIYTQTVGGNGVLIASYNNVLFNLYFDFVKFSPNISIKSSDILVGQNLDISIVGPSDISDGGGSYKVTVVGVKSRTQSTVNNQFSFKDVPAGDYTVTVVFSGNEKYASQNVTSKVSVNKYSSTTKITTGVVEAGSDLILTITTNTAGNITLTINNITETLILNNNQATYTINSISRGDYHIKAVYNGNERYDISQDSIFIEVDNVEPNMSVSIANSSYGDVAVVNVNLNDDAGGFVTATVGGITNSSEVIKGRTKIYISGVDVGVNHEVSIFYTGDDSYLNKSITTYMNVSRGDFTFTMKSQNIFIGQDEAITIIVPAKTKGSFTINGTVLNIPMSGEVTYILKDLNVGNYTITALFEGDNYNSVSNHTTFEVREFDSPQWSNSGGNTENTQKSNYVSNCDGDILWITKINSTIVSNIVMDNEGNIYVATVDGIYSYGADGNLRWIYSSDGRMGNFTGLTIGRDVIISPRAGDTLYFVNLNGTRYGYSNIYQASSLFAPIIDSNANIYTVSEYQYETSSYNLVITPYSLWENGGDPILIGLGNFKPSVSPSVNEDIYVVIGVNSIMVLDASNNEPLFIKTGGFKNIRPVIGEGNLIYAILGDSIVVYRIDASQFNQFRITEGAGDNLLVDDDLGIVYVTNSKGNLYSYDVLTGEENLISDLNITSGVLIDGNHNLYFASNNVFYSIDSEGKVLWKTDLSSKITGTPVMNKEGVIYVVSEDNRLFALGDINLNNPELEVTVVNITQGENLTITIRINNETTGNVSFTLNGMNYSFETSNGTIIKVIPDLPVDTYTVNVTYPGDSRFNKTNKIISFTVKSKETPITDRDNPNLKAEFINNVLIITLNNQTTGNVSFTINGVNYSEVILNGRVTKSITAPGDYNVAILYPGDLRFNSSSTSISFTIKSQASVNIPSSSSSEFTITLPSDATGTLTVKVNGQAYTKELVNGKASITLPDGSYDAVITYSGDSKYAGFTITKKVTVQKPVTKKTSKIVAKKKTFKAKTKTKKYTVTLKSGKTPIKKVKLIIKIKNKTFKATTNKKGKATFKIKKLTKKGKYTATIKFAGNKNYKATSKKVKIVVK